MRRLLRLLAIASLLLPMPQAEAGSSKPGPRRPGQYKRVHQRAMKHIERGKPQDAIKLCEDALKGMPDDPDTLYCMAVAQVQLGELEAAVATASRAVGKGLPIGRFLAGPRDLLKPLVAHAAFQQLLKKHPGAAFVHGPMLGCVTDTSAKFWVRTDTARYVAVIVASQPVAPGSVAHVFETTTSPDADFTGVIHATGLKPDTEYEYRLSTVRGDTQSVDIKRFRTFPAAGKAAKFRVAFGGGAGYVAWNERVWNTVASHKPLALLLLGDNVYIDDPQSPLIQRFTYYRRQSRPEWRALVARTPVYAIWDDHDFGTNDCVPGPQINDPPWKLPVWRVFTQNWNNPAYGGGASQPGCWFAFAIGDVDFIMTDSRFYRTNPKGPSPTLLGPAQKAWLLKTLAACRGTFKVLINGVPWAKGTKGGSRDTWDGFPAEREEIFSFLEKRRIDGVFLLSADRHRSDVWKTDRPNGTTLHEFESSRLTNQHVHRSIQSPDCLFSYNAKQSFGLLDFDTTAADPTVTYRIVSIDGEEIHAFTLKKSQMKSKGK